MNVVSRGARNAFRNYTRTLSIVVIIGLSIGLSLSMLVARQAVSAKIASVNASVGTTITVSPAGVRGFEGGGNPLTETQLDKVTKINHVESITESLSDRLTTSDTNLQSAVSAGTLGQRFSANSGESVTAPSSGTTSGFGGGAAGGAGFSVNFTPPITVNGTTAPTDLSNSGGGTFKLTSGKLFSDTSSANVALVGSTLATKNNLKVGSTFTAYSTTITVSGIFDAGNTFSNNQIIMPLTTVQTLSSQVGDVTSATVTVDTLQNVASTTSAISKQLGSAADVTNQIQDAQSTITPLKNIQSITLYSLIGAIIAGAVIIFLIMIMIVRERRREIGVLKAIGASNMKVMWQFMSEALTLTLLGAIVGIVIGVAAASPITKLLVNTTTVQTVGQPGQGGTAGGGFSRFGNGGTGAVTFKRQSTKGAFRGVSNSLGNIQAEVGWSIILYGIGAAIIIAIIGSAAASLLISKVRPSEVMRVE
jgi:putative ABC transport system permease protein